MPGFPRECTRRAHVERERAPVGGAARQRGEPDQVPHDGRRAGDALAASTLQRTFPVTASAQPDGTFSTQIYLTGSGDYRFRVRSQSSDTVTPSATVTIGG